jgi:predicted nucleotidyltransferase
MAITDNTDKILKELTETLKKTDVIKIIVFGSFAYGQPNKNSDIDIIVVTPDEFTPRSNRKKMELHHKYNNLIANFRKLIPIDLIVYTNAMYRKLEDSGSLFIKEINQKGIILYEANNKGVA